MGIHYYLGRFFRFPRRLTSHFYIIWNRLLFNVVGVNFGSNLRIYDRIFLQLGRGGSVHIGNDFFFTSANAYNPLSRNIRGCIRVNPNAKLIIGNNVGISSACLWVNEYVNIGDNVKIGGDCIILDSDAHSLNYLDRHSTNNDLLNTKKSPIFIGNDVLIGTRTIILKGVRIGDRAVIGSGSVVTKDIPNDCIAAGNPCRVIKKNER
ncbi:acyltransferase [Bacteroides sp. 224]|uniref:acyltransferase n=1 Tax=Bacteroides sp. 224 TaxID=2302936 RepID=UPI0013D69D79|nr:acyltransferase [Bacteroides sp. 224]NDV64970.1 acyltransferase [Bacteroides sp. 224]